MGNIFGVFVRNYSFVQKIIAKKTVLFEIAKTKKRLMKNDGSFIIFEGNI